MQGIINAPQGVPSNDPQKLSFGEGDKLEILGNADGYYLAKSSQTGKTGLVASLFVKNFYKNPNATVEVS